jgi:hypothetical protein
MLKVTIEQNIYLSYNTFQIMKWPEGPLYKSEYLRKLRMNNHMYSMFLSCRTNG